MTKPEFVYAIAIARSPEDVWAGLTQPEFTRQYWQATRRSVSSKIAGAPH